MSDQFFDDDGQPVSVTNFDFESLDRAPESGEHITASEAEKIRAEGFFSAFEWATLGTADSKKIGERVLLISFKAGRLPETTQAALAERMGVTPGRISQMLSALEFNFIKD